MTTRAHIATNYTGIDLIDVYLLERHGDTGPALVAQPVQLVMEPVPEGNTFGAPTLRLTESMARALYEALTTHFGGSPATQTLRKDYDHERGRVDKLIDHLIADDRPAATR